MKLPKKPPSDAEVEAKMRLDFDPFVAAMRSVDDPLVNGEYVHWDKLRHLTPPGDFSREAWWFGLRVRRQALAKSVPLKDKFGRNYSFSLIDQIQEALQSIDSLAHGTIRVPEQVTNERTRNRYIVRSLMEEAITSSQIEGASTTREVAKEMIREERAPRDRSERMILNNYQTMRRIGELRERNLDKSLIYEIHEIVTLDALDKPGGAGRLRRPEENIRVEDVYGTVYHTPPDAEELEGRLDDFCNFANSLDMKPYIHPVVRSTILHFAFGYDHPFVDGNGRTARALFYWSMLHRNYWIFEYISISEMILKNYSDYERAYLYSEDGSGDITYFVFYHIKIIQAAIDRLYQYIDEQTSETQSLQAELRGLAGLNHRQKELIGHALKNPYQRYTYESHRMSHGVVFQTARTDILDLVKKGLLKRFKLGRVWNFIAAPDLREKLRKSR
jgi:Fic family protein